MSNYHHNDKSVPIEVRLDDWAQNNEMIDNHYLPTGELMMEAALALKSRSTLAFDDENDLRLAINGKHYFNALFEFKEKLRMYLKHTESSEKSIEDLSDIFWACCVDVDFDEIE